MVKLIVGPHVKKLSTAKLQMEEAQDNGWGIIQTFPGNPRTYDTVVIGNVPRIRRDAASPLMVAHCSYPVFFVSKEETRQRCVLYIAALIEWCGWNGYTHIVIHLGMTKGLEASVVIEGAEKFWSENPRIKELLRANGVKLLIENVAAAYEANIKLHHLAEFVHRDPEILGWCLDLAHSNAAGVLYPKIDALLERDLAPSIVHANYPGSPFGSGLDRHGWLYRKFPEDAAIHAASPENAVIHAAWMRTATRLFEAGLPFVLEGGSTEGSIEAEVLCYREVFREEAASN